MSHDARRRGLDKARVCVFPYQEIGACPVCLSADGTGGRLRNQRVKVDVLFAGLPGSPTCMPGGSAFLVLRICDRRIDLNRPIVPFLCPMRSSKYQSQV